MGGKTDISIRRRCLFALLAFALIWGVCEFVLLIRFWMMAPAPKAENLVRFRAHPYTAYASVPNRVNRKRTASWNALGLRGPEIALEKPPDTVRILCIGASTTFSTGATTDSHTYPARMERILADYYRDRPFRIEVINGGVEAATSLETLIRFQTRMLDLSPDVAVFHHGLNDAWIKLIIPEYETDLLHARRTFHVAPPKIWEWSPLLSFLSPRRSISNPYHVPGFVNLNVAIFRRPELVNPLNVREIHPLTPAMLAAFRRNVRNFIHIARGNGVIPVLSTMVYKDDRDTGGAWFYMISIINNTLRDEARRESIVLIDFDDRMKWDFFKFEDDCHLRDREDGLGAKARIFADGLIAAKVVEQAFEQSTSRQRPQTGD